MCVCWLPVGFPCYCSFLCEQRTSVFWEILWRHKRKQKRKQQATQSEEDKLLFLSREINLRSHRTNTVDCIPSSGVLPLVSFPFLWNTDTRREKNESIASDSFAHGIEHACSSSRPRSPRGADGRGKVQRTGLSSASSSFEDQVLETYWTWRSKMGRTTTEIEWKSSDTDSTR